MAGAQAKTPPISNMAAAVNKADEKLGNRKFYDVPDIFSASNANQTDVVEEENSDVLIKYIEENCFGRDLTFAGPFGGRRVVYCDYVASGRSLRFLEEYISANVLPYYGNTHTTTSTTSLQTTLYRHEARTIIRNAVNASEHDAVIFVGSGATAAVHKLIHALNFKNPPIVLVGPFEHHSSILPWKEIGSEIIWISEDKDGAVDLQDLENKLKGCSDDKRQLIGCFSAASNITGILTDTNKVTECLHRHKALAVWDYATAGPYTEIDMNPVACGDPSLVYKDAIFISPHKFIGGVGTPGILVAKKKLFENTTPSLGGGGSVFFVTHNSHRYLKEIEMREEGGTPAIVESIRAGLVFQLKQAVGCNQIMKKENEFLGMAKNVFSKSKNLMILGNMDCPRLPIFSFLIQHEESGLFLHHNFVSALLNDLFGIQSRGGCACAGPYAQDLLGINEPLADEIESALLEDSRLDRTHLRRYHEYSEREMIRPGFTRINLTYFLNKETVSFILEGLVMYTFNHETGEWRHRQHQVFRDRKWLGSISYSSGAMSYPNPDGNNTNAENNFVNNHKECLLQAEEIFKKATIIKGKHVLNDQSLLLGDAEKLRWFLLPSEAERFLRRENLSSFEKRPPFTPLDRSYLGKCLRNTSDSGIPHDTSKEGIPPDSPLNNHKYAKRVAEITHFLSNDQEKNTSDKRCSRTFSMQKFDVGSAIVSNGVVLDAEQKTQTKFHNPPRHLFNLAVKAIDEFEMIKNGDRILVCVSGGKDSLSMLHIIYQYQFYAKTKGINFTFGAATVDPGSTAYDPSPLKKYMEQLGVEYFYERQGIIDQATQLDVCESICSFCSRMKRGRLYACARRNKYNVLAIGQHLDDIAESFIMSVFHNGLLRTMKANYYVREKDLRVIRPLTYVREKDLRNFAEKTKLPVIAENCPACFEAPKERHRVKQLLATQELLFPRLFKSIMSALKPLMARKQSDPENKESCIEDLSFLCK